mmetsp:Transcript_28856/g.56425  ORF Transcript_28856/g.56425 Transcript_28856/m.56425 type:complete len:358 (-) Transcript_28856:215-1288(-)
MEVIWAHEQRCPDLGTVASDVGTLAESLDADRIFNIQRQAKVTGWLLKRKGDAVRSRVFGSSNRRFFTLDFEAKLFYYSHTESNKTASVPVPFRNLSRLEPLSGAVIEGVGPEDLLDGPAAKADWPSSVNKGPLAGKGAHLRAPKLSFRAPRRSQEQHGFIVSVAGREMELLCSSKAEADEWVASFRRAIASGSDCPGAATTAAAAGSLEATDISTSAGSASEGSRAGTPQSLQSFSDNGLIAPVAKLVPTAAPLSPPMEGPQLQRSAASSWGGRASGAAAGGRRAIGMLLRRPLQQEANRALTNDENVDRPTKVDTQEAVVEGSVVGRYEDKAAGLSLQERLAQMEFSDSEGEDCR